MHITSNKLRQALTNWILFSSKECHPVVTLLEDIKPDDLSPRQALELLYRLKGMVV